MNEELEKDTPILENIELMPDDYVEEEAEDTTEAETDEELEEVEEVETDEVVEEKPTDEVVEAFKLEDIDVKFNHETKKLNEYSKEEIATNFQKGMNYDNVNSKLELASDDLNGFKEVAELLGYESEGLKEALLEQALTAKAETDGKTIDQAKKEYKQNKVDVKAKQQQQKMEKFVEKYPSIKGEDIKPETWAKVKDGMDLLTADEMEQQSSQLVEMKAKLAEFERKAKIDSQNEKVKKKSPIKGTTNNGADDATNDDFLQGLFG